MHLADRAYVVLVMTALLLLAAIWSDDPLLDTAWPWTGLALLAGLAAEGLLLRSLRLTSNVEHASRLLLGRAASVTLVIQSNARSILHLDLSPVTPEGIDGPRRTQTVEVAANKESQLVLPIVPVALGLHAWTNLPARVRGTFGLAWWDTRVPLQQSSFVAPDAARAPRPRHQGAATGIRPRKVVGAGSELYQLRDYLAGDPPARIDWKASARRAALMTRELSEDQHLDVVIAIDAGRLSRIRRGVLDRLSLYGNLAARFAAGAVANDDRIGLVVYADRVLHVLPPSRGLGALIAIRRTLERLCVEPRESEPMAAAIGIRRLLRHRGLVVLLTDLDDASIADELARVVRLLMPPHQVVIAGVESAAIADLARREAQDRRDPYVALSAREHQASSAAQRKLFARLGVPVVAAAEEHLEAAVFVKYEQLRRARRI